MNRLFVRRFHVSWHIAATCVGIVIGVASAHIVGSVSLVSLSWLMTGTALVLTACWHARAVFIVFAVLGGIIIGLWRGSGEALSANQYDAYIGSVVTMSGVVNEDKDSNKRGQTVLRLRDVRINQKELPGTVWVTANTEQDIRRSDKLTLSGRVSEGFGSFSASVYSGHITAVQRVARGDLALEIRDWFAGGVNRAISEPQSSLGLGYLVGQRRGLPEDLDAALQAAGLTHIVVASGYNLTILVRLSRRLFEKVSKYLSFISAGGMIAAFVSITGLSPSMSRAGLVAGLSLIAWYYGRRFHPLVLLPFAMAVTVLVQPSYAWGDLGWQLSFAAFAGVMVLAPLLQVYFYGDTPENMIRRIFIETMAATIATLPIIVAAFGQFSLVAPLANVLILPLVPLAMLLTFVAGIAGLALPAAAAIIGFPAQVLLSYMVATAEFLGGLPWAVQEAELSMLAVIGAYAAIIAACFYMQRVTRYDLRTSSLVE